MLEQIFERLKHYDFKLLYIFKDPLRGRDKLGDLGLTYTHYYIIDTEKAMASHSRTLAWKIPWMEEPGRLQSMGSLRVRHD